MPRVLVVDDDAAILKLVSVILTRAGHEVRTCAHPNEALDLLNVMTPDLVISDVVMPYMTGYEFLEHVRAQPNMADLPFMLLSSHAERDDVRRGMNLGADDYLPKPFTPHDLTSAVDARLRRAGQKVQAQSGLEARALGTAQVMWQGQHVQWVSRKALELFFFLLERKEVSSWEAAEALWPEKDEARASSLFHTTLHRLRRSLSPEAVTSQNRRYALTATLNPEYDVRQYERLAGQAERARLGLDELRELVDQYGEFLPGVDSPWCDDVRQRLQDTQISLLGLAARAAHDAGRHKDAAHFHQKALTLDPLSEPDWSGLERALSSIGDSRADLARQRVAWWATDL
ncbi:response regulator [Deinococcus maricopensis]|uniref:Response regulator receiver and SARP domain protein n=1 Tax=Deinococcus maricopensis (strain DSM 21211 / LMG 22137 / NRRL B-23946 / LB-34) TaxID=709986 RepID=E8U542_DEIML|nr:response regulator [Deinococcus maricopensis]ADV66181.1 response regulator receiver and SARP domain protein [Deinococcus maricopensis DSM 21211]